MAKVTSKFQVTLPRAIAGQYKIQPGDNIAWEAAGDVIRVLPPGQHTPANDRDARMRLFDQATARQRKRGRAGKAAPRNRGWRREDLYSRGRSR